MIVGPKRFSGSLPRKQLRVRTHDGKEVIVRVHASIPKGCSVPRQLCIKCRSRIHKNDSRYEKRICRECEDREIEPCCAGLAPGRASFNQGSKGATI
jgi:hypothetical protein